MKNDFTHYLTKFFAEHLPSIKGLSTNTVSSYKDTLCRCGFRAPGA